MTLKRLEYSTGDSSENAPDWVRCPDYFHYWRYRVASAVLDQAQDS
jgi:hypothetical protein